MGSGSGAASSGPDEAIHRGDVLWRATLDAVLVRPLHATEVVKLEGTGRALWEVLSEPCSFDSVCAELARTHDADPAQIAVDLRPVIDDLVDRGVVSRSNSGHTR